jgi:putative chitinase
LTPDGIVGEVTWNKLMGTTPQVAPQVGGLNLDKLKGHIPDSVISQIPDTAAKFGINTPIKLAHFLAQCGHESGGFKVVNENLNYSSDGLKKIFTKYFKDVLVEGYARNPEKIANRVYGGRMGNGPESTGEGWKFRGRGFIQLTGKDNYTAFGKAINEDISSNPDLVSTKYPLLSAAWFFSKNCLGKCVDASESSVTSVTKCVNGGTIGLEDRIKHFKEYYNLLS